MIDDVDKIPNGITINHQDGTVIFKKNSYTPFEIEVALCYGFKIYKTVIIAEVKVTLKEAMFDYIKLMFPSFITKPEYEAARNNLYVQLASVYDGVMSKLTIQIQNTVSVLVKRDDKPGLKGKPLYSVLMQHQMYCVQMGITKKILFYALQQGLGKTITSISRSLAIDADVTLIVCPAVCKYSVWLNELVAWGIDYETITVLDTRTIKIAVKEERFIIINYDIVSKFMDFILSKNVVHLILDEATYVKNIETKRFKAIQNIVRVRQPYISFLSGTPIQNRLDDLFSYLKLGGHQLGNSKTAFLNRFTIKKQVRGKTQVVGGTNLEDLTRLLSNFMIRRRKDQCLDLPDKIYSTWEFELEEYMDAYLAELENFRRNLQLMKKDAELHFHRLLILTTKAKLKSIMEFAENIAEAEGKVAIYCSYKEPLQIMQAHFGTRCVLIDGSVPNQQRDAIVNEFRNNPDVDIFLSQMEAGGFGLNLQFCNNLIIANFPLTYTGIEQVEDRFHRIGVKNNVNIYYTVCKDSIDEKILYLVESKRRDSAKIIDRQNVEGLEAVSMTTELIKSLFENETTEVQQEAAVAK